MFITLLCLPENSRLRITPKSAAKLQSTEDPCDDSHFTSIRYNGQHFLHSTSSSRIQDPYLIQCWAPRVSTNKISIHSAVLQGAGTWQADTPRYGFVGCTTTHLMHSMWPVRCSQEAKLQWLLVIGMKIERVKAPLTV